MNVKFVLQECLKKLGESDFLSKSSTTAAENKEKELLLHAVNETYRSLLSEYFPATHTDEVEFKGGKLQMDGLTREILYPIELTVDGVKTPFVVSVDSIEAKAEGKATLKYAYMPQTQLDIEDDVRMLNVSVDLFSDGVLAQYCYMAKLFDLAKYFDDCYRDKLFGARYKNKTLMLKDRRWQE